MANTHDKRFYQLTLAIQKAINAIETPVKEKHVRSTIIGTFQEQSAITYWMVAIRQPLQENRIVAWKFCHVTHKLLREGHPACLDDSQRHIGMIENLGKLWVHLREGYGKLVSLYCSLLVCKLKFHARNPRFPGNMQLTAAELDAIAENDVNNYFQLCVELFDYMEDILNLQAAVFDSLGNARANSMTASGQCRLAALIPCAQDASQLYDCNVRALFRLHASLPPDTLAGHRERFRQQFKKLSSFYKHASSLQYYRNLLTLPVLPSNPPNFLLQSEFGTYVTPVVSIPEPPPDELDSVASLVDTSDTISQMTTPDHLEDFDARPTPSPQPDPIVERDRLIDHLQNELKRMRSEVSQLVQERNTMLGSMREHCTRLESQLQTAKVELEEEKQKADILAVQTPEIKQKLTETEEKAKVTDEKFQKLKGAYTQLREEHINLIRQKAEVDKLSASLRAAAAQHESAKLALQQQLDDRVKDVELLQQSASSSEEIEAYKAQITNLRADVEQSRQKEVELETLKASMEALQIEHTTATKEQEEKLTTVTNELKETKEILENITKENHERETELTRVKEELVGLREKSGDEYKKVVEEKEAAVNQLEEIKKLHAQEKELLETRLDHTERGRLSAECELQDLLQHNTVLEADLAAARRQLDDAQKALHKQTSRLVSVAGEAAVEVTEQAIAALEHGASDNVTTSTELAAKALDELARHTEISGNEEAVAKSAYVAAHSASQLSAYVCDVTNVSTDTELVDKLNTECRSMLTATKQCLESIKSGAILSASCGEARSRVRSMFASASAADRQNTGDRSVDDELADMDRAIEEAASQIESMLAATRAGESGVKLEVNGKILDACTTLMGAVKILVQDARKLQQELGDHKTRQKMYRKNPQWSEGLISAAKAVVFAAKLLVTSADEAVGGTAGAEGVSAAAHEVAGSTAQLVAASRARAAPDSPALAALTRASRHVAAATGALVAAVKAGSALVLEQEALDTSALSLTATRRLEMESKVRALKLETALDAERARLAALRKRHYQLAQVEENGNMENGKV